MEMPGRFSVLEGHKKMKRFELLVETESFANYGGWVLDSQFEDEMGSPYLLAHGIGVPVADATTTISMPESGEYNIWVRTKDWVPEHHPGRFELLIDGRPVDMEFGASGLGWSWELAGDIPLPAGEVSLALHDLTGFDGRCDAIYITNTTICPPNGSDESARAWRRRLLGLSSNPSDGGSYDVVVVGGGIPGCCAAYAAAKSGSKVALIHDRPFLGGNASAEVGLTPEGEVEEVVDALAKRQEDGDIAAASILSAMSNVSVFLEERVYRVLLEGKKIEAVDARCARTSEEMRFYGKAFVDCTGRAQLGLLTGAATMFGQEARSDFGESLAPDAGDLMHHGNTVMFRTEEDDRPIDFPEVPWATEVAGDFSDLSGQIGVVSSACGEGPYENQPGPYVGQKKAEPHRREDGGWDNAMSLPKTHFWEYGQWLDPYSSGEDIRDHLMRAIIGTYVNVRAKSPERYANLRLAHLGYVAATGGFRRYVGDYVLTENDVRRHESFPDGVVINSGAFCLHYPEGSDHDFRLGRWEWVERDGMPYEVPFRCLYSADIDNLLVAGKHISATHIASSTIKLIGNGGQHGIATGVAAALCAKYDMGARDIAACHMDELKELIHMVRL